MTKAILLVMALLIIMVGMAFVPAPGDVQKLAGITSSLIPAQALSASALAQMQEPTLPQPKVAAPDTPEEQKIEAETKEETESAKMKLKKSDRDRVKAEPPTLIRKSREDNREEQ